MSVDQHLLREGIVNKLKALNAYIDNELTDYIMVMIANKKTVLQINKDLQLFLGKDTSAFTDWLQSVLNKPSLLDQKNDPPEPQMSSLGSSPLKAESNSPIEKLLTGSKREVTPTLDDQSDPFSHMNRTPSPIRPMKVAKIEDEDEQREGVQRIRLPPEDKNELDQETNQERRQRTEPKRTRDQDLRSLIRRRKAETTFSDNEEEGFRIRRRGGVSSVVQVPERSERPKGSRGTSRLLQKAIHDIHGRSRVGMASDTNKVGVVNDKSSEKKSSRLHSKILVESTENVTEELVNVHEEDLDEFRDERKGESSGTVMEDVHIVPVEVPVKDNEEVESMETVSEEIKASITAEEVEAATIAAVRKVIPQQSEKEDLRLLLNRSKKKDINDESTRFVVTISGADEHYSQLPDNESDLMEDGDIKQNKGGLSERCKFWPNCKNGDSCPYHHPTVPCRLFPNCKYGQKCCFVHPVCKYDGRCTKQECPYLHTVPKVKQIVQPRMVPMTSPFRPQLMFGSMMYGGGAGWHKNRYPNKQSLKWTPTKPVSDRQFAVDDNETASMPVK